MHVVLLRGDIGRSSHNVSDMKRGMESREKSSLKKRNRNRKNERSNLMTKKVIILTHGIQHIERVCYLFLNAWP